MFFRTIFLRSLIIVPRWWSTFPTANRIWTSSIRFNKNKTSDSYINNTPSFISMFRDSPICQLGLPENKIVIGKIVKVVDEDIYIDFGFKFLAVCRKPKQDALKYCRGAKVKIRINDLELSERFLGSSQDMTLLEADATLISLHSTPVKSINKIN